ncbi:MAG: carbohydrate kinase family protein [Lachnospiraceae bacterium]|nr:carbohydrate kinase family protein [Lachnospiraceae bacterium]
MREKKWDVYVYGDVNIDLVIPDVEKFPEPGQEDEVDVMETLVGGGAALFTLGIGKLGLRPVFQGAVGNDCYGRLILEEFEKRNVDTGLLKVRDDLKTGISISFTGQKDRSFLTMRGTNAEIDISRVMTEEVKRARHIHVTGYAGSVNHDAYLAFLKRIKEETDVTVSFDVGWDFTGEWKKEIYELFPYIDVLFMNETEAVHYSRKETAMLAGADFAKNCRVVALKLGAKGSVAFYDGRIYRKDRYQVTAVDTTGAGDSFNAGFIYGYLSGKSMEECLSCGNACGALSVTKLGGNTGFPNRKELQVFISSREASLDEFGMQE